VTGLKTFKGFTTANNMHIMTSQDSLNHCCAMCLVIIILYEKEFMEFTIDFKSRAIEICTTIGSCIGKT
jgi:hypothetical protein